MMGDKTAGITFDVNFDQKSQRSSASMPKRFIQHHEKRVLTVEALEEKQKQAEERRKSQEMARIERIRQKDNECKKITQAVSQLIDGGTGKRTQQTLSRGDRQRVIRTVQDSLDSMNRISDIDDNFFKK